jgi:predicted phage-related endonuclease
MQTKIYNPKDEVEWLELRSKCLTASDMAIILGFNKYTSMKKLVESKSTIEQVDSNYMRLGRLLEPVVKDLVNYRLETDFELVSSASKDDQVFYADLELGFGCTPDALNESKTILLECKSTKPKNFMYWSYIPKIDYLCQLYSQMIVLDIQKGYLGIMSTDMSLADEHSESDLIVFEVQQEEWLTNAIIEEVKLFWVKYYSKKQYRVNRDLQTKAELYFRLLTKKVL